jgi:hypothetical protein
MMADRKAELFGMQAQKQETARQAPLELEPAHSRPLIPPANQ